MLSHRQAELLLEDGPEDLLCQSRSGLRRQDDVAKDHPDAAPINPIGTSIAPRLPRHVECEMKNRVQPLEKRWIEVKPSRIERRRLDKPAANRVHAVGHGDARVKGSLRLDQPATRRNVARRVDAVAHVGPKLFQSLRPREQAAHADDRDCFVGMHHSNADDSSGIIRLGHLAVIFLASFGEIRHDRKDVDQARKLAKWVRFAKNVS